MPGIHINGAYPYVMYMLLNAAYVTLPHNAHSQEAGRVPNRRRTRKRAGTGGKGILARQSLPGKAIAIFGVPMCCMQILAQNQANGNRVLSGNCFVLHTHTHTRTEAYYYTLV